MPYESTLRPLILEQAILLFGERGYHGVTTEALATASGANEASIFQQFKSKEALYHAALTETNGHSERALGKALLDIFAARKNREPRQLAFEILRMWYLSLPQAMTRLLQQILIANPESRTEAFEPIKRIIDTVVASLEGKTRYKPAHVEGSTEILVAALFQYKIMRPQELSEKEEMEYVTARITHWLDSLLAKK